MKTKKFLVVVASAFLLSGCNLSSGSNNGAAAGEEVDYKTFVRKMADSIEKNEFFIKDGVKSNKELKGSGNISYLAKVNVGGKETQTDDIQANATANAKVDLNNDIAKADLTYKVELNDGSKTASLEDSFSGQLQGEDGKLYAIDLKDNKSGLLLEEFAGFKSYLDYIPNGLEKTPNWKETYVSSIEKYYDELINENEALKKAIDGGLIKYYVNGDKFTAKFAGKGNFDIPSKVYENSLDSETGETLTEAKVVYTINVGVSGSYTIKLDLTNGNESYGMSGNANIVLTIKDAVDDNKFNYSPIATTLIESITKTKGTEAHYYELGSNDSLNVQLNAKLNLSLKDSDVTLEKVSL